MGRQPVGEILGECAQESVQETAPNLFVPHIARRMMSHFGVRISSP